jgi:hypothetical protein
MAGLERLRCSDGQSAEGPVWVAPALQAIFAIAMVCQYSRVSGLT